MGGLTARCLRQTSKAFTSPYSVNIKYNRPAII